MSNKKSNVFAIGIMFFLFAMISFVTGLQNPMGVIVKTQFGATNAMSQLGNLANFIAYAFMGLPAGFILKKYGYKITALAAVAVGFIGVAISFLSGVVESFPVYLSGAFVSGFSMCMLNTVVNPMLNTLGGGGNKGNQLIQLGGSLNSLAATIVPVFVGYLMGDIASAKISDANPALFIAMGIFALAFVILLVSYIPEPELEAAKASSEKSESVGASVKGALSHNNLLFGIIAIFVYVGVEVGIPNIANLYMTTSPVPAEGAQPGLGISTATAGAIVGLYWLLMLCGRLLGGVVGAKVSSKMMMTGVTTASLILLVIGIFLPADKAITLSFVSADAIPVKVICFILCGLCTSIMWGSIFNLAVEGLGKYTSIASGLFMVMVCGGGILPYFQGLIADKFGYIESYWLIVACVAYMLIYTLFLSAPKAEENE